MPMTAQEHVNAADIPIVWTVVALDFFTQLPWPGIAAFLAAVYTLCRLLGMAMKAWRRR
jgi:hypothetical protein